MRKNQTIGTLGGGIRDWQRWVPYAAVAWSLVYTMLGVLLGGGRAWVPLLP